MKKSWRSWYFQTSAGAPPRPNNFTGKHRAAQSAVKNWQKRARRQGGMGYYYGSAIDPRFERSERVEGLLEQALRETLPDLRGVAITHRWGGAFGMSRDMMASVNFDEATGIAIAGGYVGDGVAASNLAGRTLRDLLLDRKSALVELPWVAHPDRFVEIPELDTADDNEMLRDFLGSDWTDDDARWRRANEAYRGSVGRWKDAVRHDPTIIHAWHEFEQQAVRRRALAFLAEHGIEPTASTRIDRS